MSEENKAIARSVFEEAWNRGNMDLIDELYDPNHVSHGHGVELSPGAEGFRQLVSIFRTAFPDIHFTVEDQIAEGDKVVTCWTCRATHEGELMGIPATGKQILLTGITVGRYAAGKAIESWNSWDRLAMMQQLGVFPSTGTPEK